MECAPNVSQKSERKSYGMHLSNLSQFCQVARNECGLITLGTAAAAVGRSRQRLHELANKGKLHVWLYNGARYVSARQVSQRFQQTT